MPDNHKDATEQQWGFEGRLSPQGLARKAEILDAMNRAAGRRRVRVRSVRAAAVVAVCGTAAFFAWLGLAPHARQTNTAVGRRLQPAPARGPVVPERVTALVITKYVEPQPGIADRLSRLRPLGQPVTAQVLTRAALTEVLAEQQTYGLAEIRGDVLVFNNQAQAEPPHGIR